MKIYPVTPVFLGCEDNSAIDLGKVEAFDIILYEQKWNLVVIMASGKEYIIKSGFATIPKARSYRNKILSAYRQF